MKKKILSHSRKKSTVRVAKPKKAWHKLLPLKFSFLSITILGCLIIVAVGLYNIIPKNDVLGTSTARSATTQVRNCYVIKVQNGKLSAQLGESLRGTISEGIYRYGTKMQKDQCRISPSDKFSHNVPAPKAVYIKFVTSSGADLPANFFKGRPGISVYMNVWQMPEHSSNGITGSYGTTVPANGKVTMYQYGSVNKTEWVLPCGHDILTPCFAGNMVTISPQFSSDYYKISANNNDQTTSSDKKNIITYVLPDTFTYNNTHICGNTPKNECKFYVTLKPLPKPTPTPRVCKTSSKQTCYYGKWCTQVSNSCSARISYVNCSAKPGYCGVPPTCLQAKGYCATTQYCHGTGGSQVSATGCSSGQICCR